MQFWTLVSLALVPFTLAAPMEKRDAATVQKDLNAITAGIASLNKAVTAYKSSLDLVGALKIQAGATSLMSTIDKTTKDVTNSKPFNEDDSTTLALGFLGLEPDIFNLLDNLVSKKNIFPVITKPLIVADIKGEKSSTDKLGAALAKKLSPDLASAEPAYIAELDAKFNDAIAAYSKLF